jgi:hypothetical protein
MTQIVEDNRLVSALAKKLRQRATNIPRTSGN